MDARFGGGRARARRRWDRPGDAAAPGRGPYRPPLTEKGHSRSRLYGALDLGTNNCRLLIAQPSAHGFDVVDAFSRIVRLGEGLSITGRLHDQAMRRIIEALRVCANKLTWCGVARRRLVATEACRVALNGSDFLLSVKEETGLELEILERETEAKLAATGAEPLIEEAAASALIFDIGGGSTELMWLDRRAGKSAITAWTSLSAGVVTISERFGGVDVSPAAYEAMRLYLRPMLRGFAENVRLATQSAALPDHLLGTSGTVTTIAGVQLGLKRYDRSRVDGCWLDSASTAEVTGKLLAMSYKDRVANPCIGRDRADLVLAGCAILEEVRDAFPCSRIRVADRGLREGILTLLMKEDGTYGTAS